MKKFLLVPAALLLWTGVAFAADPIVSCKNCHGKTYEGKGKAGSLVGVSAAALKASLTTKIPAKMAAYSKNLTPEQIDAAVADVVANAKAAPAPAP